jgi:hypothetical protein
MNILNPQSKYAETQIRNIEIINQIIIHIEKKFVAAKKLSVKKIIKGISSIINMFTNILAIISKTIHHKKNMSLIFLITIQLDAFIDQKTDFFSIIRY